MTTREKILSILNEKRGAYVSGAEIANKLDVSRASVWKAVNRLRGEGHRIEAVTNRGYRLAGGSDVITASEIAAFLDDSAREFLRIDVIDSVSSTNDLCLECAAAGEAGGYAAVAGRQTGGRGRRGRSFFSPADTGLYISLLLRPQGCTADKALRFTTAAAVSVCEAIERVCLPVIRSGSPEPADDIGPYIKWVNDIYMRGRKVCGILTEASFNIEDGTLDYAVIGIGINVYAPEGGFPDEIADTAGSVLPSSDVYTGSADGKPGSACDGSIRNRLAAEILNGLVQHCILSDPSCIEGYRQRCMVPGRDIDVISHSGSRRAKALGLDDECRLLVRYDDGSEEWLSSGEISIRM